MALSRALTQCACARRHCTALHCTALHCTALYMQHTWTDGRMDGWMEGRTEALSVIIATVQSWNLVFVVTQHFCQAFTCMAFRCPCWRPIATLTEQRVHLSIIINVIRVRSLYSLSVKCFDQHVPIISICLRTDACHLFPSIHPFIPATVMCQRTLSLATFPLSLRNQSFSICECNLERVTALGSTALSKVVGCTA